MPAGGVVDAFSAHADAGVEGLEGVGLFFQMVLVEKGEDLLHSLGDGVVGGEAVAAGGIVMDGAAMDMGVVAVDINGVIVAICFGFTDISRVAMAIGSLSMDIDIVAMGICGLSMNMDSTAMAISDLLVVIDGMVIGIDGVAVATVSRAFEEGLEDGAGDEVLGEHLDDLCLGDGGVEIIA